MAEDISSIARYEEVIFCEAQPVNFTYTISEPSPYVFASDWCANVYNNNIVIRTYKTGDGLTIDTIVNTIMWNKNDLQKGNYTIEIAPVNPSFNEFMKIIQPIRVV